MKQYHIVLQQQQAREFKEWLKDNGINYEPSGYGQGVYFSIRATKQQADEMNAIIERLYNQ